MVLASILQPDGIVEFIELDPRRRVSFLSRRHSDAEHRSKSESDWTDVIADRFRDPSDAELATSMPSLMKRIDARIGASLRPKDGVAAVNLKSWLQVCFRITICIYDILINVGSRLLQRTANSCASTNRRSFSSR